MERSATIQPVSGLATPVDAPTPPSTRRKLFDSRRLHRLFGSSRLARSLSIGLLARLELALLAGHKDTETLDAIKAARTERESLLTGNEAFMLFSLARAQRGLDGDMAEVGVYQGCSAKIISMASGATPLHLFDTFTGLPNPNADERTRLRRGQYASSLVSVQDYLVDQRNISFYSGVFPETSTPIADLRFSLVHLDVDLKTSTLDCLEFFYPRMVPGGVILTHDYSYLHGVRAAFAEFCAGRRERPVELPSSQAMLIKL